MRRLFDLSSRVGARFGISLENPGRAACWPRFYPPFPRWIEGGYYLLRCVGRQWWIWALLIIYVLIESYFVRELASALLFFTVLYTILAALAALYILIDHAICWGVARALLYRRDAVSPGRVPLFARAPGVLEDHSIHGEKSPAHS